MGSHGEHNACRVFSYIIDNIYKEDELIKTEKKLKLNTNDN